MQLLGRRRRLAGQDPNSIVGAGGRVDGKKGEASRRSNQPWQDRSFEYYKLGGPAWYAAQFYARMLQPLKLYIAEENDEGELVPSENEQVIEQLDRIQDPGGGRTGLLASYGRLSFLVGEAYLFVSIDEDTEREQWEMLSPHELKIETDRYIRQSAPGGKKVEYKMPGEEDYGPLQAGQAVAYRLWRRDPEFSNLADAPMRAALDDFEELLMLTRAVRSRARSRFAGTGGILFIDDKISPAPPEPAPGEDPVEDPYLRAITLAVTTPIANEGAASEVVPIITRVPVPEGKRIQDMVYHLQLVDATHIYPEAGMRVECINRIAIDLDMPPEVLTGTGDVNHWGAWMIDESTWKGHGQPIAQQFCDDLTAAFLRPALKQLGLADWAKFSIAHDPSEVVNRPDRSKDAKDLHDRGALSNESLRDATGFDEDDAPTDDEMRVWLSVHSRDPHFALDEEPPPMPEPPVPEPVQDDTVDPGRSPAEVERGAPPAATASGNGHMLASSLVLGAAQMALLRAREAAGNRLRSLAKRKPEIQELIQDVHARDVPVVLGRERVRELNAPPESVLVSCTHDLIVQALKGWGIGDPELANLIVQNVEQYAARTLYQPTAVTLPPPLANYIAGLAAGLPVEAPA